MMKNKKIKTPQLKISFTYDEYDDKGMLIEGGFYNFKLQRKYPAKAWDFDVNNELNYLDYEYFGGIEKVILEAKKLGCIEQSCPITPTTTRVTFSSKKINGETQYNIHFAAADQKTMRIIAGLFDIIVEE